MKKARSELDGLLADEELQDAALLVFANKQASPDPCVQTVPWIHPHPS